MNLFDFSDTIDVFAMGIEDTLDWLYNHNRNLFESSQLPEYTNFIKNQSSLDISSLQIGNEYCPMQISAMPIGKFATIRSINRTEKLTQITSTKLHFSNLTFPKHPYHLNDLIITPFIFNTEDERDRLLMALKLKFSDWTFSFQSL